MDAKVRALLVVMVALSMASAGCLVEEEQPGEEGDGLPHEGTTEGFRLPDIGWTDHTGHGGSLRGGQADFLIVHVLSPDGAPFLPQFAQVRWVRQHFSNVTVQAVTLRESFTVDGETLMDLRERIGADWTFGNPDRDLRATLSLVSYPTVFVLDRDQVVLERSDDILGAARIVQTIEATWGVQPRADAMPGTGEEAPELVWRDIDDNEGALSSLRGSPVILNVWEMECPFCLQLFDELVKVHANHSGEGLRIVSLDLITWETEEQVRGVRERYNATWTFAVDGDNIQSRYDIWRLPLLLLLDSEGVVQWTFTGYVHSSVISGEVEKLI